MCKRLRAHIACATALLLTSGLRAQTGPTAGSAKNGKRLFTAKYCSACHGTEGQGGSAGARLAPRPVPFAALVKYLRQPTGQMPPYTVAVITDRELADIYAFLGSVKPPPAADAIQLLKQ